MAKGSKLKQALDRYKNVDHKLEKQQKQQKAAEKRKRSKTENEEEDAILENAVAEAEEKTLPKSATKDKRSAKKAKVDAVDEAESAEEIVEDEGWETDEAEENTLASNLARLAEDTSDSDESDEEAEINGAMDSDEDDEDDEEDVPLSDLESVASEDKGDIIPHQRLTINNTTALLKAHKSIALSSKLSFSENQVITSDAPIEIADIEDDLNRELAFYKQSLEAVTRARALLKADGVSFSRPTDYFAEMVKSDEHMGKIKQKLIDEAASKRASSDARRQRDLKKFGKQVQIAKLQERDRSKRDTMDKINLLKRKRQGADIGDSNEDKLFDVALEDAAETAKKDRSERRAKSGSGAGRGGDRGDRGDKPNYKRAKKDDKFGFGGKKRFNKSNDAKSSADTRDFSVRKMKGGKKGSAPRPGKSKRTNRT